MDLNRRMPRVDSSRYSMIPSASIPRSKFITRHTHKTTFQTGYLIPIMIEEVLPGDIHEGHVQIFARLATLIFPIMDNVWLETFFFFTPNRIVWTNWKRMMGERINPSDSISYTVPLTSSPVNGFAVCSIYDYFGLPTVGQMPGGTVYANALPFRMYNLIWNEWFRDQNLQNSVAANTGDGPDSNADYTLLRRNKKHDYFTSGLPWPLKGGTEITLPMGGQAPIRGVALPNGIDPTDGTPAASYGFAGYSTEMTGWAGYVPGNALYFRTTSGAASNLGHQIYADLSSATGATINALRLAAQTQVFLERDARSGTRYTELLRAHFGVLPEDSRLQRPEYIGGGKTLINVQAIPQTNADRNATTNALNNPLGALGGTAVANDRHSFQLFAKEHGFIIGLVHVTADITYQQGMRRQWTRQTRLDYYWPEFAHLGEQAIRLDEIYAQGTASDSTVFAYQERWAEYRDRPSQITGMFRSTTASTIDTWHLSQKFTAAPALNTSFIQDNPPLSRVLSAGTGADNMQVLFDSVFEIASTRAMPMFSTPGMMDRF